MRYHSGYSVEFNAGRRYRVSTEWVREGFGETDHDEWVRVSGLIDDLVRELRDRDLSKMLGPHHPSAYGIAAFFMDRLRINCPISRVEVHEYDGPSASIEGDAFL